MGDLSRCNALDDVALLLVLLGQFGDLPKRPVRFTLTNPRPVSASSKFSNGEAESIPLLNISLPPHELEELLHRNLDALPSAGRSGNAIQVALAKDRIQQHRIREMDRIREMEEQKKREHDKERDDQGKSLANHRNKRESQERDRLPKNATVGRAQRVVNEEDRESRRPEMEKERGREEALFQKKRERPKEREHPGKSFAILRSKRECEEQDRVPNTTVVSAQRTVDEEDRESRRRQREKTREREREERDDEAISRAREDRLKRLRQQQQAKLHQACEEEGKRGGKRRREVEYRYVSNPRSSHPRSRSPRARSLQSVAIKIEKPPSDCGGQAEGEGENLLMPEWEYSEWETDGDAHGHRDHHNRGFFAAPKVRPGFPTFSEDSESDT